MARTRLDLDRRREQLLSVGIDMLATHPAETLSMGAVARAAGVSKGLPYHYFRDKEEFFSAVIHAAAAELVAATEPDPTLPPMRRLEGAIDGLITYAEDHAAGYIAIYGGAVHIPWLADTIKQTREQRVAGFVEQIAEMSAADSRVVRQSPALRLVLSGQIAFLQTSVLHWLEFHDMERAKLRRLLVQSFFMALAAVAIVEPQLRLDTIARLDEVITQ